MDLTFMATYWVGSLVTSVHIACDLHKVSHLCLVVKCIATANGGVPMHADVEDIEGIEGTGDS